MAGSGRRRDISAKSKSASQKLKGDATQFLTCSVESLFLSSSRLMLQASIKFDDAVSVCAKVLPAVTPSKEKVFWPLMTKKNTSDSKPTLNVKSSATIFYFYLLVTASLVSEAQPRPGGKEVSDEEPYHCDALDVL